MQGVKLGPYLFPSARNAVRWAGSSADRWWRIRQQPAMLGVGEALSLSHADGRKVQVEDLRVVSLGAGNMKRPITRDDAKTWGSASWIRPLLDVIFDGTSEMSHLTAKALLGQEQYVRLQVQLVNVRDDLDDASRENLDRLRVIAVDFTQSDAGKFQFDQALRLLAI
jgi:hypothetical protein